MVNSKDEVLMVVEKFSPAAAFQGSWKLPGGLADPGEHFVTALGFKSLITLPRRYLIAGCSSLMMCAHGFRPVKDLSPYFFQQLS